MSAWQPISTAPKVDQEMILLYLPRSHERPIVIGYWSAPDDDDFHAWYEREPAGGFPIDTPVTHWMPLPDEPELIDEEGLLG